MIMASQRKHIAFHHLLLFLQILLLLLLLWFNNISEARTDINHPKKKKRQDLNINKIINNSVSAIFVFGDSTVDPGNNNYVTTIFKSNFRPYGRDFFNQIPTGRFTNGRLPTDYIASYVGVKEYVPPYLDPKLSIDELMTGTSFASAGSGFDPLTSQISSVIPISRQLEYFKKYKQRLESTIGKQKTEDHIRNALFIISAGTNDFVVNYFTLPMRKTSFTVLSYQQFLIQHVKDFIQGLWADGARRIGVVGLTPMGCLPIVITLHSNTFLQRDCVEKYSSIARNYNQMLQKELHQMHTTLAAVGARIYYIDVYIPMMDMIQSHGSFGFDEVDSGCCGTGFLEASFLCNPNSLTCSDANKYVFWDSIHPTEKTYYNIFKAVRSSIDILIKN